MKKYRLLQIQLWSDFLTGHEKFMQEIKKKIRQTGR